MKRQHRNPGFTLAELMIALVVTALLLTAIGSAMHASLTTYRENEKIAAVTQTARSILGRMTRDIRTADAISYSDGLLRIIPPEDDGSGISEIQYQQAGAGLLYRITKDGTQSTYSLVADGDEVQISSFSISQETGQDWKGENCIKSLSMRVTFLIDGKPFSHAATARPRRNLVY